MKGSVILLASNPRGLFKEGIVYGTPYPGTLMTIKAATEPDGGGAFTWEPFNAGANGHQQLVAVLLEPFHGASYATAYGTGERCRVYCPAAGEELNMLVSAAGTGTGDAIAIGGLLIAVNSTGLLIATTGTVESEPFIAMETVADVVAGGTLVHCMYTGH